jgi:polar amino acid transport system substrate-binding protein
MYGIDIEIAQLYAESKGLTLVVKNIDFDAIFTNVESGYADMGMAGITVSEERQKLYDFTNPYYQASQKLIVKGDNTAFDNCKTVEEVENILKSLNGNKIGYQIGTTGELYVNGDADWGFEGFTSVTPTGYKTAQLAIQDIINGQIYGVVVDEAPAASMVKAMNAIN